LKVRIPLLAQTPATIDGSETVPSVTVVIPYFNAFSELERAADSLLASSCYSDISVVVVDNSTDETAAEGGRQLAGRLGWSYIAMDANYGFARACNTGARNSASEFLFFMNQDAVIETETLATLTGHLAANSEVAAVAPSIVNQDGRVWFEGGRYSRRSGRVVLDNFGEPWRPGAPKCSGFLSGCALLIRRSVFEAVSGFDERYFLYYEDVDLSDRIRAAGWSLEVIPDVRVVHYRGAHGDMMRNLSPVMLTETIRSRRIYAATRPQRVDRAIARLTLPLELARLAIHAIKARPAAARPSLAALWRGSIDRTQRPPT